MRSLFDTKGHDSDLNCRSGQTVEVIRQLGADEVDIPDVGLMYRIRFDDGFCADAFIEELPDVVTKRLCEAVFDITTVVLYVMTTGQAYMEPDSRAIFEEIWTWAKEFEDTHPAPEDYMTEVEEFALDKLVCYRRDNPGEWPCDRINLTEIAKLAAGKGISLYANLRENGDVSINAEKGENGLYRLISRSAVGLMKMSQGAYFERLAQNIVREFDALERKNGGEEERR